MTPGDQAKSDGGAPRVPPEPADESPGVPGFRTWAGVYWFAFGVFVAGVVALTIFSRIYA